MSIYDYNHFGDPKHINNNPHDFYCDYCGSHMHTIEVHDDVWSIDNNDILSIHKETVIHYKEQGLEDYQLNLRLEFKSAELMLSYCKVCGWWRFLKDIVIPAEEWQIWDIFYGCTGVLKNMSLTDITLPIEEIRRFLTVKYEKRFSIHPRLFEEVVGDVFKENGYYVYVTGYSNDGGIDVVLGNSSENLIGVQVKRYKNKIKAEQIRAFAGALMLSGCTKGIFVTTSDFQPSAVRTAESFSAKTLPIQLMNAADFYNALKISQKTNIDVDEILDTIKNGNLYSYDVETPRNSL